MILSDLAAIGSFISGIGVLASLIYLGFQIRQNTLTHRATANESRMEFLKETMNAAMDPELIALRLRVETGDNTLTDVDCQRYMSLEISWFIGNDHLVWLHDNKILDDAQFESEDRVLGNRLSEPGVRATWAMYQYLASPRLRTVVEQHISNLQPGPPMRFVAMWRAAWQAELGEAGGGGRRIGTIIQRDFGVTLAALVSRVAVPISLISKGS